MRSILAWLLLLSLVARAAPSPSRIDRIFPARTGAPGYALAVVSKGRVVYQKGYGLADLKRGLPIDGNTAFDLASVSKQFTATAIMILADRGRLSYQDPLSRYFPDLPAYARKVTLEQLLWHTSGLPDYEDYSKTAPDDLVAALADQQPLRKPGKAYEYLNMGYALLGYVVAKAAGHSLGDFLQKEIFDRLGMRHSRFLSKGGQQIRGRAVGYRKDGKSWKVSRWDCPGSGDGNVFSTSTDLALWAIDLLHGSSLVKARTQKRGWTSGQAGGKPTGYGYGWSVEDDSTPREIWHSGSWTGTSTCICLYPQVQLGVIVLCNVYHAKPDPEELAEKVAQLYLP